MKIQINLLDQQLSDITQKLNQIVGNEKDEFSPERVTYSMNTFNEQGLHVNLNRLTRGKSLTILIHSQIDYYTNFFGCSVSRVA